MRDNDTIILAFILISVFIIFGGQLGIAVTGGITGTPKVTTSQPNILNVFGWIWDGVSFFFGIISFMVPGMPYWESTVILLICIILPLFVFLKFVRGGGNT